MLDQEKQILELAAEMAGGEDRAATWFRHRPMPGWAGKAAYDLVTEGKAENVVAYLEPVHSGVYAWRANPTLLPLSDLNFVRAITQRRRAK